MLEPVLFSVAALVLVMGSITDIRMREVPDWLNFAGIIAGLGIRGLWSITTNDWSVLGWGVLGFAALFVIAVLMYYTGQWGGGDSKLLMALGALLGLEFSLGSPVVVFIIWALFVGAAYGLVWSMVLAARDWAGFVSRFRSVSRSVRWAHLPVLGVLVFGIAFAIASDDELFRILVLIIALAVPALFYAAIGVKAVEQCCMYKTLRPDQLTEGDWIAKPVVVKGRMIVGPKDLGITKEKIKELKRLNVKNVLVKEGIPFVPSFLIAFVLTVFVGNPLLFLFG
jgi:Flp pilus assembly protein protease CpaA